MAGRAREQVPTKGMMDRSRAAPVGAAQASGIPIRSVPQAALGLQRRAGNQATARVLARVTYPHLRAVDTHYRGETQSAASLTDAVHPKLDGLKAIYANITSKSGNQVVSFTVTGPNAVVGLTQITQLHTLGGPYDPATKRATATVTEWYRLLNRWRDVFNEEYFSLPLGPRPVGFPGRLPHNFNYTPQHRQWITSQLTARGVRRDTDAERRASTVTVQGGRLVRGGRRVDTSDSVTWFKGLGWEIFVLSPTGELHMASHLVGRRHHSSLLGLFAATAPLGTAARDAASAGEMLVRDGKIQQLSTKTGHYMSGVNQLRQIVHALTKRGADLSGTVLLDFAGVVVSNDARTWWATGGQLAYETMKANYAERWYQGQYSQAAIDTAFQAYGWTFDAVQQMWRKQDGNWANARDVRKAFKMLFPRHFDPAATYGAADTPTALSI